MKTEEKIIYNYIIGLKKKDIDFKERSNVLIRFRKKHGISQRELAKQIGVPHSTLQDWERWDVIDDKEYEHMKEQGLNDTQIYRQLRNNINKEKDEWINKNALDLLLESTIKDLNKYVTKPTKSDITEHLVLRLKDMLNRLSMYLEKTKPNKYIKWLSPHIYRRSL